MSYHVHHSAAATTNPAIAQEINAATKKLHVELNRLIIERLPLALPPHTRSPTRYAIGLTRFAPVFVAFEEEFAKLKKRATTENEDPHNGAVREWVTTLLPTSMERSERLRNDLRHLQQVTKIKVGLDIIQDERAQISALVENKPHLLVAYAWIMYMAIFSGGRWIRQQLNSPSNDFWQVDTEQKALDVPGFSFLSFDEENDGEGLKAAFKQRLTQADGLLTDEERQDIVTTGQDLFQHCIDLIERTDRDVWWLESTANWGLAFAALAFGFVWLLWRIFTGQSILTE